MAKFYNFMFVLVILTASSIRLGSNLLTQGVGLALKAIDVAKFGFKLFELFNDDNSAQLEEDIQRLGDEIEKKIELSTSTIVHSVFVAFKLNRIEDTDVAMNSFLQDLQNIITSTGRDRENLEKFFVERFSSSDLLENLRYLPELLTTEIPGSSGKLLDILTDQTRCNMTAFHEFKTFYFELFSSGIGIHVVFNRLKLNKTVDETMNDWTPRVNMAIEDFEEYETRCKDKFEQLAKEDIRNTRIKKPDELKTILNERYSWKIHDVYFLRPRGTSQFLYLKSKGSAMILQKVSDVTRLVISIDKDRLVDFRNDIKGVEGLELRSRITGDDDEEAAKHVSESVVTFLNHYLESSDFALTSLITYFNETGNTGQVSFNEGSPVMRTTVKDLTLSYCHKSGFECLFDTDEVNGNMMVYFYVSRNVDENSKAVIGTASKGPTMSFAFIVISCWCVLKWLFYLDW